MKKSNFESREFNTKTNAQPKSEKSSAQRTELIKARTQTGMTKWFTSYSGITKW
jgi:hypothetical protein